MGFFMIMEYMDPEYLKNAENPSDGRTRSSSSHLQKGE